MKNLIISSIWIIVSIVFFGCGGSKPTPKIQQTLQMNQVKVEDVCRKYSKQLKYKKDGNQFVCDAAQITPDMILWTKLNDISYEKVFNDPKKALKWKNEKYDSDTAKEWIAAGFDTNSAKPWRDAKINAFNVQKWKKAGFKSSEAKVWNLNSFGASNAKNWKDIGFTAKDARAWMSNNFTPTVAKQWREAGFNPIEAKSWKLIKFNTTNAKNWKNAEFTAKEAEAWMSNHFTPSVAKQWKEAGFNPSEANLWKQTKFNALNAKKWKNNKFSYNQAKAYKRKGVSLKNAIKERKARTYANITMDSTYTGKLDDKKVGKAHFIFSIYTGDIYVSNETKRVYKIILHVQEKDIKQVNKKYIQSLIKSMKQKYTHIKTIKNTRKVSRHVRIDTLLSSIAGRLALSMGAITRSQVYSEITTDEITTNYKMRFKNKGDLIEFDYYKISADGKVTYTIKQIVYTSRVVLKKQKHKVQGRINAL